MPTLLDRYLLGRFVQALLITFLALFGLYVVLDVFANLDEFTRADRPMLAVLSEMVYYYCVRSCEFFNTTGSLLAILSALLTLAWTSRCGELSPVLSAGIPTYRLAVPLLVGNVLLSLGMVANQEWLIPRLAQQLQRRPGQDPEAYDKIKPAWDFVTNVYIAGGRLFPHTRELADAEFVLPVPEVVTSLTSLRADQAVYLNRSQDRPAGWWLKGVTPAFKELRLTPVGSQIVLATQTPTEMFIVSDVTFDHLANRNKFFEHLSTPELLERAANPASGIVAQRGQSLHVHMRLIQPFFNLSLLLVVIPIVLRRETRGLVVNLAFSLLATVSALGLQQTCLYLGQAGAIRLDLAAWLPVILCGITGTWLSARIRT